MDAEEKEALNLKLYNVCNAKEINYELAEQLLKQGAEPLGKIKLPGNRIKTILYGEVVDALFDCEDTTEALYKVTEMFLKYGMDVTKPVPYDENEESNPLWTFAFFSNDNVLKTIKILLDHGLNAEDAGECWGHAISDFCNIEGDLTDSLCYEFYYDYLRKLMLIASYPHVLEADEYLRKEIWLSENNYDLRKFREWQNYEYEIDTSHCIDYPEVYRSVVTIIEKSTKNKVWKFGVCLKPEDIH